MLGESAEALLEGLLARGLVERASSPARPPSPPPTPSPGIDLPAAKLRALDLLERLFGPGGGSHGDAVRQAADAAAFERVLEGIHDVVRIYQGKRRAGELVQRIRVGC